MKGDMRSLQHRVQEMQHLSNVNKRQLDLLVLRYMTRRLHLVLPELSHLAHLSQPLLYTLQERYGHRHYIALYNFQGLFLEQPLLFVGFINRRYCPLVVDAIQPLDEQLLGELVNGASLLSYSSLELRNGDWCNLMLLGDANANIPITGTKAHTYTDYQLAYRSYNWIRLHKGVMPKGLDATAMLLHAENQPICLPHRATEAFSV